MLHPAQICKVSQLLILLLTIPTFSSCELSQKVSDPHDIGNLADILRTEYPGLYGALNDPVLTAVTREFGFSVVSMAALPLRSEVMIADKIPWSSWWYPKKEDFLFNDAHGKYSSALTKYDYLRRKWTNASEKAADYERSQFNPDALTWEGLCDAWAIASVSMPEPKRTVVFSGITFSISDLKALALLTYGAVDDSQLKIYGQKFTGNDTGWIYPDIFPEQFHRFVEVQLNERKQPFIMDHDASPEVWNVPVYKANFLMAAVPEDPDAVFVRTWLYSAESSKPNEKEFVGTREAVREYNYILKGHRDGDGNLVAESGYWVKGPDGIDSRKNHPDYLIAVPNPEALVRKSWNPEIEISVVDQILQGSF